MSKNRYRQAFKQGQHISNNISRFPPLCLTEIEKINPTCYFPVKVLFRQVNPYLKVFKYIFFIERKK